MLVLTGNTVQCLMSQTKTAQPLTGAEKVCQSAANSISIYYFLDYFRHRMLYI